jgi:acyl-coenzyme A synthetase/AMP-(fatty) acid ligase
VITRIYRTGDIGKFVSSFGGPVLEYVGRNDNQMKIRGQRLEPGEIEGILCEGMDGAGEAAVVVTEDDKLIAYVVRRHVNSDKEPLEDAEALALNDAWDAFHAQYDWENISPSLAGADFTGWVRPFLDE